LQQDLNDTTRRMEESNASYVVKIKDLSNQLNSKEALIHELRNESKSKDAQLNQFTENNVTLSKSLMTQEAITKV
jgi:hypothetical protein